MIPAEVMNMIGAYISVESIWFIPACSAIDESHARRTIHSILTGGNILKRNATLLINIKRVLNPVNINS